MFPDKRKPHSEYWLVKPRVTLELEILHHCPSPSQGTSAPQPQNPAFLNLWARHPGMYTNHKLRHGTHTVPLNKDEFSAKLVIRQTGSQASGNSVNKSLGSPGILGGSGKSTHLSGVRPWVITPTMVTMTSPIAIRNLFASICFDFRTTHRAVFRCYTCCSAQGVMWCRGQNPCSCMHT